MAVCKKGILLSDLLAYASVASGVYLNDDTIVAWAKGSNGYAYSYYLDRYYYPSFIIDQTYDDNMKIAVPTVLAILSYNQRNTNGDDGWHAASALTAINGGSVVPLVTDEASLEYAFNILGQGADDARSLRAILGQDPNKMI
jgi:hypothetical protein